MTDANIDAAWGKVHDALPVDWMAGLRCHAMRLWRILVLAALLAGCVPRSATDLPAEFKQEMEANGWAFEVTPVMTADTHANVVAQLASINAPMFRTRAVPIFGLLSCTGEMQPCRPGPYGGEGDPSRPVWVVVYPDWIGDPGDVGYALVDVVGIDAGYDLYDPRRASP